MIVVLAEIDLQPGTRAAFLEEFRKILADVRAEDGCIEYGPTVDAVTDLTNQTLLGEDRAMIVEKWRDAAALKAHLAAPHMVAYRPRVKDYVKSTKLTVLESAE